MIPTARILLGPAGPRRHHGDSRWHAPRPSRPHADGRLAYLRRLRTTTHFGNWVLVPVRDLPQLADLPPLPGDGARVDLHRTLIEASDIAALQEGQRVTLHHDTTFGGWRQDEGRILRKGHRQEHGHLIPYVTILAKGKRKLGWEIRAGDYAAIVPLENSHA